MAARPQLRRKTTWPGFFSNTMPVRALPSAHLDEDAEVYQRVKHLQHLRAVQDALDETDVRNTRPGYNPQLDDLFGDPLADRSRFTDVFGNQLGIGQTLDSLLGKYGTDNVPGEHNEDPGSARGSSRTGMASQDAPSSEGQEEKEGSEKDLDAVILDEASLRSQMIAVQRGRAQLEALQRKGTVVDQRAFRFLDAETVRIEKELEAVRVFMRQYVLKKRKGDDRPRHDDEAPPARSHSEEFWRTLADLILWGTPATDFKLERGSPEMSLAEVLAGLWDLKSGGHPAIYDRLGTRSTPARRLSEQERRKLGAQIRLNHPGINWGDRGPSGPPGPALRHVSGPRMDGWQDEDDD